MTASPIIQAGRVQAAHRDAQVIRLHSPCRDRLLDLIRQAIEARPDHAFRLQAFALNADGLHTATLTFCATEATDAP